MLKVGRSKHNLPSKAVEAGSLSAFKKELTAHLSIKITKYFNVSNCLHRD